MALLAMGGCRVGRTACARCLPRSPATAKALPSDNQLVDAQHRALATSRASLELQRLSYEAGKSNLLQLVDAQRTYQQARLGDARAVAPRYQDVAQLAVAMGGGWWQAPAGERQGWGTGH